MKNRHIVNYTKTNEIPLIIHEGDAAGRTRKAAASKEIPLEIIAARTIPELEPHASAWNNLALESKLPMLSQAWVRSYLETQLGQQERWLCLFVYDGKSLAAVLPLIATERRIFPFRRVEFRTPYNNHTPAGDLLIRPGWEKSTIRAISEYMKNRFPNLLGIKMERVPDWSPMITTNAEWPGIIVYRTYNSRGSIIRIDGDYAGFQRHLGSNFRRNLRRWEHRLAELGEVTVSFLAGREATEDKLERFIQIEGSGWKGRRGSAIINSEARISFYRALVSRLAALGWLEWHFLKVGDEYVAGHLAIRLGRSLTLFKIGFNEKYAHCAPGNVLISRMLERIYLADNTDTINFLIYSPWNERWPTAIHNYYNFYLIPRKPLPVIARLIPLKTKSLLRRFPGLVRFYRYWVSKQNN